MTYFRVFGWFNVSIAVLGIFGSLDPFDGMGLVACILWLANGAVILALVDKVESK